MGGSGFLRLHVLDSLAESCGGPKTLDNLGHLAPGGSVDRGEDYSAWLGLGPPYSWARPALLGYCDDVAVAVAKLGVGCWVGDGDHSALHMGSVEVAAVALKVPAADGLAYEFGGLGEDISQRPVVFVRQRPVEVLVHRQQGCQQVEVLFVGEVLSEAPAGLEIFLVQVAGLRCVLLVFGAEVFEVVEVVCGCHVVLR